MSKVPTKTVADDDNLVDIGTIIEQNLDEGEKAVRELTRHTSPSTPSEDLELKKCWGFPDNKACTNLARPGSSFCSEECKKTVPK